MIAYAIVLIGWIGLHHTFAVIWCLDIERNLW